MKLLFLSLLLFTIHIGSAQTGAQIVIEEEPAVARMMTSYIEVNKTQKTVEGWRIQVFATADRQQFDQVKRSFEYRYPNISTNWVHAKPYFKLRAGAFATKLEATRMLHVLKKEYPQAYLAVDNQMNPMELLH